MKKNFLISTLVIFLMSSLFNSLFITTNDGIDHNITDIQKTEIASNQYLTLSYQDGNFYSWNQQENPDQHIIGFFTNNQQSYLLDNFGVFWSLDYQILNFVRIDDETGVAQIKFFQDQNNNEYFSQHFFVKLNNNKITIIGGPILSKNTDFAVLNQEYIVSFGIGLDLIKISDQSVKVLVPPYDKGNFLTSFYRINDNNGIFIAGDKYFYLLKDISGALSETKINLIASDRNAKDVVVINDNNLVIRDEKNKLYFFDVSQNVINNWDEVSTAKNIAFALTQDTFILNVSTGNSGFEYGKPYLVKTNNWEEKKLIPNINTINNFMLMNDTKGVFINQNLLASTFIYQSSDDSFTINDFGSIDSFQFVNKDLFFGSLNNNNFLLTQESNQQWAASKSIKFNTNSNKDTGNLLNNVIVTNDEEFNYQNTYFSNGFSNISVTDDKLVDVVIKSDTGQRILKPKQGNVTYTFLDFIIYQIQVNFFSNDTAYTLHYKVQISDFSNNNLLNISGENLISYVGYSNNNLEKTLYDIKSINQKNSFTINKFDYSLLQYVELYFYEDTKNLVVNNFYNIKNNTEIKASNPDGNFFFGLKIVNLLNQVTWIYLGFSHDSVQPMIDFWDTDFGKSLMKEAIARRYLEQDLRNMNSQEIQMLIAISNNWQAIATQGKAIVIGVIIIFFLALNGILFAGAYNILLDKKIAIQEVEKNKILKNPLDF